MSNSHVTRWWRTLLASSLPALTPQIMAGSRYLFGTLLVVLVALIGVSRGLQCTVVEGQLEYDLSELAAEDHWHIHRSHRGGEEVIYLSLCHPLRGTGIPSGCAGNDTGVCIAEVSSEGNTSVTVPNAGQVSPDGPSFHQEQWLEYVMESGTPCPYAGETYRTTISFICAHTPEDESGPVLMSSSRCQLLVAWMTQAACPRRLDAITTTPCSIQFPSSDHKLHLQTLRAEQYFSASSSLGNYEINICGPVLNGHCNGENVAVCHMSEDGSPEVVATTENMKVRWEEDNETLTLAYQASDQGKKVEIMFTCDRGTAETRVNYVTQNDTTVTFVAKTSAVCPPTPIPHCVLENHVGEVFDLRPLHREQENWEVVQSTKDGQDLYFLNICGPVNPARPYTCPSGLIGACKAGIGEEAAYNLGLLNSEPTFNTEDGSITVLYSGGDPCKEGQHSHSTRINLICSTEEYGPVLIKKTETCEHVFDWLTPAACPRHFTNGSNCRVEDPLYGNVFDLNPLRKIDKDYKVTTDGDEFLINLCGPLVSSCDGQNGIAGVCQINKDHQFNAGLYTPRMTFSDGTLMIKYPNGTSGCEGNNTRFSQVVFLCDHEVSGRDGPTFFHHDGCSNTFFWKTKHACPPFHVVDCTLHTADGLVYDLQELSSSDTNLEYFTTDKKYILNVCRSVVHQKGSRCAYRAGACITDRTHLNSSVNIGEVQSGPYLEDGRLMMRYAGGDQCDDTKFYQTLVEFKCDKDETFPMPQFIGEENCTYYFEIKSAAACPVPVANTTMLEVGRDCKVTSPSGYTFDLSPLKQEAGYVVNGSKNMNLTVNVCAALSNPECPGENIGVCSKNGNAGQANADLYYLPEHLSLHYAGGEQCSNGINRSTIITFVCGAENATEGPVLVFDDDEHCMYFITWYTELACEKRISCFVDTWIRRIDLSPLIKSTGNYKAVNPQNPKEKFYLNVCRPLNPIVGLNCRPGSAVCISNSASGKNPLSLGHPNITPVSDSNGATIMYTHGAKCTSEPDYNYSSKIHFICDPSAGKGSPVFKEMTHDCQYQFEWRTSVACDMLYEEEDLGPQCQIRYDEAKANIDLKPLHRPGGYHVKFGNKNFTLNVCGSACNTSGSCSSDGDSYGLSNKSDLSWNYGHLTLRYYGGSHCSGSLSGHKTTTVHFECDMSVGYGHPVPDDLMEVINCHAVFNWKTNVTCIEGIYATEDLPVDTSHKPNPATEDLPVDTSSHKPNTATKGSPVDTSSSNNTTGQHSPSSGSLRDETTETHSVVPTVITSILVVSCVIFVVGVVLIKSKRGNRIVAATRRFFGIHGYSHSQSHVENSTLLGPTSSIRVFRAEDSDDDLLRV